MNKGFIAKATIIINTPPLRVWDALVNPELIKQYLFGTQVVTDWKLGSPITYKGIWEGKTYEDKGNVQQIEPGKLLVSTFWMLPKTTKPFAMNYLTKPAEQG
jgi:uncharacterized protein YndB with AHSA1/START domain